MLKKLTRGTSRALVAIAILGASFSAQAVVIQPPGPVLPPGALPLSARLTASGETGSGGNPTLTSPGSYNYGTTFTAQTAPLAAPYDSWGFYDTYVFTVGGSFANSVTTTINLGTLLGISNLQARLYSANPGETVPVLGAPPAMGSGEYFLGWTSPIGPGGQVAVIDNATLTTGTYVLEIRGLVTGGSGGSYAGVLNLTPVPLPAGLPLLLTGMGLFAGLIRRGRGQSLRCALQN